MNCPDDTTTDRDGSIGLDEAAGLAWRVGRKVGRTVYATTGGVDRLIGVMDTPELAERVVRDHNARLAGKPAEGQDHKAGRR
jgi:hypothetical protein